jgi:predicted outer membrane repeat protein
MQCALRYFLLLAFLSRCVEAQTQVPPGNVSGTWTLTGSPYHINGEITIPNGETLTIEPGVSVIFTGFYRFLVQGRVLAVGTMTDTITFTAQDTATGWRSLRFIDTPSTNDSSLLVFCKIEWGRAQSGTGTDLLGGGIYVRNFSKLRITHALVQYNRARWGGGIQLVNASAVIEHSTLRFNYAEFSGGAFRSIDFGLPVFRFNRLVSNSVGSGGGAIYLYRSDALVVNCLFSGNSATASGGAVAMDNARPWFINNLFTNNQASNGGAFHFTTLSDARLINNTMTANTAGFGGALYFSLSSSPDIINSILWGNNGATGPEVYINAANSDPNFYHSVVRYGTVGFHGTGGGGAYTGAYQNNIEVDPLFSGAGEHPFSLVETSPAINAGRPDTSGLNFPPFDLAGNPRIVNGSIDIGAYEFSPPVGVAEHGGGIVQAMVLHQNYPNPFNPTTTIRFDLPEEQVVQLTVFNLLGQEVARLAEGRYAAGVHSVKADFHTFPSGVYLYRLRAGAFVGVKKLLVVK